METEQIIRLANERLVPLFSGAKPIEAIASTTNEKIVAYKDVTRIKFKLKKSDTTAFIMQRRQGFEPRSAPIVNEFRIVDAFVQVANEMEDALVSFYSELQDVFSVRLIATALANQDDELRETLTAIIDQFDRWSKGTYEGRQHSAAIIVVPKKTTRGNKASDVLPKPYYSVLSNGYDTAITCSKNGFIVGHTIIPQDFAAGSYAPYRLIPVANLSKNGKISFVLNRKGEILIFKNQQLCFARRGGQWHFLTHMPVIMQIKHPTVRPEIRKTIYETCLDASFAGTGACIGIILDNKTGQLSDLVNPSDLLSDNTTPKNIALNAMIAGKNIVDVHRLVRLELAAIDGAMIINEHGTILSVGTILKIESGSDAGGRLAAAIALSNYGVGIKVSQDGSIRGFHQGTQASDPVFALM